MKESEAQSRFEVAVQAGLTPLVGREEELALLRRAGSKPKTAKAKSSCSAARPGIGKSRLVQELKEHVAHDSAVRIEFRCSPYHQNSAFYPLIEHVQRSSTSRRAIRLKPSSRNSNRRSRATVSRRADTVPLLAALLSLPHPEAVPPLTLSPQQQKQKTQEALVALAVRGSRASHGVLPSGKTCTGPTRPPWSSRAVSGPSAHGTDADAVDLSARVYAALGVAFACQSPHAESVRTEADRARWSSRSPAGKRCRLKCCSRLWQDGWRAAVRRRIDQNGLWSPLSLLATS